MKPYPDPTYEKKTYTCTQLVFAFVHGIFISTNSTDLWNVYYGQYLKRVPPYFVSHIDIDGLLTECPKIYRKSVLHLLKYTTNLYNTNAVQICGKFWETQYNNLMDMQYNERSSEYWAGRR